MAQKEYKPPPPTRMLTLPEAAVYVRLSKATMFKLLADGKLTARRIGGRNKVLFDIKDLDAFLDALPKYVSPGVPPQFAKARARKAAAGAE